MAATETAIDVATDSPTSPPLAVRLRRVHSALAPVVLAPLAVTAATGVGYRLLRDWGGLDRDRAHVLMVIHEGEWLSPLLGRDAETLYVLLNGLGLAWMLATGAVLAWQRLRRGRTGRSGGGG
jgi:hypothetical protein